MLKNHVVCANEGCNVQVHVKYVEANGDVCPKCAGVNQTKNSNKKENVNMNNQTQLQVKLNAVNVKGAEAPVQMGVALYVAGETSARHSFHWGYPQTGGRVTYLSSTVDGKPAVKQLSRADFLSRLRKLGVADMKKVERAVSVLKPIFKRDFVVGKCIKCNGDVTAAETDYMQRSGHKEFGCSPFAMVCLPCQNKRRKEMGEAEKTQKQIKKNDGDKSKTIPASASSANENSSRQVNREKAAERRNKEKVYLPEFVQTMIRDFVIDVDQESVEAVKLIRQLKRFVGSSHEAANESSTEWAQEQYIENGKVMSEDEELIHAWGALTPELTKLRREERRQEHLELKAIQDAEVKAAERSEAIEDNSTANEVSTDDKPKRKCSICREPGHTKRTCPNKPNPEKKDSQEEVVVHEPANEVSGQENHQSEQPVSEGVAQEQETKEVVLQVDELPEDMQDPRPEHADHSVEDKEGSDDSQSDEALVKCDACKDCEGQCPECRSVYIANRVGGTPMISNCACGKKDVYGVKKNAFLCNTCVTELAKKKANEKQYALGTCQSCGVAGVEVNTESKLCDDCE